MTGPSESLISAAINDPTLCTDLKLGTDPEEQKRALTTLVTDVAVTKLGGKKAKQSFQLKFRVQLRPDNQTGLSEIRWVTIITKKQDLKSSLRCVKAYQGLAQHLTKAQYDAELTGKRVSMQMFEIGTWMQRGGTNKFALKIKRQGEDGAEWITWRIRPGSWLGGTPMLPHPTLDPKEKDLQPKGTFVALNTQAAVHDVESHLPPGAGFWAEARETIRWKNIKRSGARMLASIPMSDNFGTPADTFDKRIEKQAKLHQWILDQSLSEDINNAFDETESALTRSPTEDTIRQNIFCQLGGDDDGSIYTSDSESD